MERIKSKVYNTLRTTEKYTKTDMVVLTKEMSWLTVGKIISIATSFLLTYILANFIAQETFGQYRFILSVFGIIAAFSLTGLGTSVAQSVSKGFEKTFPEAVRIHMKWGVIMSIISIGVAIYYFIIGNQLFSTAMLLVAISAPIMQSQILYSSYLQGKRNFKADSIYGFWYTIIPAILIAASALIFNSFLALITTYFLSYSLIAIYLNKKALKTVDQNSEIDKESIEYGKHLSYMGILGGISSHLDKVLIFYFLGPVELALYSIAMAIPQQLRTLDRLVTTISTTRLPKLEISQIKKILPRKSVIIFIASFLVALAYILVAPIIFRVFLPTYTDAIFYTQFYVLIMLFSPIILMKQTLTAHNRTKDLYIINTTMPLVKIISLLVFLPPFGVMGAFYAIFLSEMVKVFMVTIFYRRL